LTVSYAAGTTLFARAQRVIPGGVNRMNLLDEPDQFPVFFERSDGPYSWDADGRRYIDLIAGKGAVLLGHRDVRIDDAVRAELDAGVMQPLMPVRYVEAAERLTAMMPTLERVKFFRTGSCAVSAAVRLCRVVTGKRRILTAGYHGWHDWFVEAKRSYPDEGEVIDFHYDLRALERLLARDAGDVAAVVVTPEPALLGPEPLVGAAALAEAAGCLLVFDEMRTGVRFGTAGYQAAIGVRPQLTTLGKAIANGYALAALGGRADLMAGESRTHLNGTYETEALGLAAGAAMLKLAPALDRDCLPRQYGRLAAAFNRAAVAHGVAARMVSAAANAHVIFEDDRQAVELYRQAAARGVLFYCFDDVNLMFAHEPVLDELIARTSDALAALPRATSAAAPSLAAVHRYLTRHRIVAKNSAVDSPLVHAVHRRVTAAPIEDVP
jgi:glutamate-1-semialdehyde 2,1-aminomutase